MVENKHHSDRAGETREEFQQRAVEAHLERARENEAHAALISAAPELFELAKLVHGSFGGGRIITFSDADIEAFEAAIAKAEGRS